MCSLSPSSSMTSHKLLMNTEPFSGLRYEVNSSRVEKKNKVLPSHMKGAEPKKILEL